MDYVSASPFRVPVARLAAAQVVIEDAKAAGVAKKTATSKRASPSKKEVAKKTPVKKLATSSVNKKPAAGKKTPVSPKK
jgi:pyruvate,orthophosphate dikinase